MMSIYSLEVQVLEIERLENRRFFWRSTIGILPLTVAYLEVVGSNQEVLKHWASKIQENAIATLQAVQFSPLTGGVVFLKCEVVISGGND